MKLLRCLKKLIEVDKFKNNFKFKKGIKNRDDLIRVSEKSVKLKEIS